MNKYFLYTIALFSFNATVALSNPPLPSSAINNFDIRNQKLLDRLNALSPNAKNRALERLQTLNIPASDHSLIHFDYDGEIYYIEPSKINTSTQLGDAITSSTDSSYDSIDAVQAFSLHSKPGAPNTIIVDFDGHLIQNTAWNSSYAQLQARPYDLDGNDSSFSQQELTAIAHIWHRIAEDFSAFDVDVTTEEPAQLNPNVGRILITRNTDANGNPMPHSGAGGVAYVGVWGLSNYHTKYSPALVYFNNLGAGHVHYTAEAATHEMGHNLGLGHDGFSSETSTLSYYSGHGSGLTKWAPIMGVGYYAQVTQWSRGDYLYATNTQDDLAIITSKLGTRADDHGNTPSAASSLYIDSDGTIFSSTPENDPFNQLTQNKGIIETSVDKDVFMIDLQSGELSLTIAPAWEAFYTSGNRGSNLDVQAKLFDFSGQLITQSNPANDTQAALVASLAEGTYYLEVSSDNTGNPDTGYTDYNSMGLYFISGSFKANTTIENLAPIAADDSATTLEDTQIIIDVLSNDADPEGGLLQISNIASPTHGNVTLENNRVIYTPEPNFFGTDAITYTILDDKGDAGSATVTIEVLPINDAPMALQDFASTESGKAVSIPALANDSDPEADVLTVILTSQPSNGSVALSESGFIYTPNADFVGTDFFTYQAHDGLSASNNATITITINTPTIVLPSTPINFMATDSGAETVQLNWFDTSNETAFEIERQILKTKGKVAWIESSVLTLDKDTVSLLDATGSGTFRYRIRSLNTMGVSDWSGWVEVTAASSSTTSTQKGGGGKGGRK